MLLMHMALAVEQFEKLTRENGIESAVPLEVSHAWNNDHGTLAYQVLGQSVDGPVTVWAYVPKEGVPHGTLFLLHAGEEGDLPRGTGVYEGLDHTVFG